MNEWMSEWVSEWVNEWMSLQAWVHLWLLFTKTAMGTILSLLFSLVWHSFVSSSLCWPCAREDPVTHLCCFWASVWLSEVHAWCVLQSLWQVSVIGYSKEQFKVLTVRRNRRHTGCDWQRLQHHSSTRLPWDLCCLCLMLQSMMQQVVCLWCCHSVIEPGASQCAPCDTCLQGFVLVDNVNKSYYLIM